MLQSKFHFVQNVLLISISETENYTLEDMQELADKEIIKITNNKNAYKVRDEELDFDVLLRQGSKLYYFSYDSNGKFKELEKIIKISDGFFGFQAEATGQNYSHIRIGSEKFYLTIHNNRKTVDLKEIAEFIKENYIENLELWDLENEDLDSENMQQHIKSLFDACQHMYIMREEKDNQIIAMRGLTVTLTGNLGFRSIAITKDEYRDKGLAATLFQQMINQYPNAVFVGYITNKELHKKLSFNDMIHPNENNVPIPKKIDLKNILVSLPEENIKKEDLCLTLY